MKFGICLDGTEAQFEQALRERAKAGAPFTYLEIGVAKCGTFQTVCSILQSTGADWRAIGIDPAPETREIFDRVMKNEPRAQLITATREEAFRDHADKISPVVNFAFIDGCHSEKCAMEDFEAVEPLVPPGGLAVFHDFADIEYDLEPHCQAPRKVVAAVTKLGLLDNSRPGWWRLADWTTDPKVPEAQPCGVFV